VGAILIVRLKVVNRLIAEAEQFVAHDPHGAAAYEKLGVPDPGWLTSIPPDRRESRKALEQSAYMYYEGLQRNDGKGIYAFTGDCNRIEDGGVLRGMMALRIKVQDRRITEVELITVREQLRPKGGLSANTAGVMTPHMIDEMDPRSFIVPNAILLEPLPTAEGRDQLVAATNRYFVGFTQSKGSLVPFDAQCSRRENGMLATNNPDGPIVDPTHPTFRVFSQGCAQELDEGFFSALSKVRGVRQLVVDEAQGLVLDLSFFDNEGNVKSVSVPGVGNVVVPSDFLRPLTYMAPQLFKIENGKIRQIEGFAWPVPFGMTSGWDK
jgi:hypothetical protein